MRIRRIIGLSLPIAAMLSCGAQEDKAADATKSEFEGTWTTKCGTDEDGDNPVYDTDSTTYSGKTMTGVSQSYSDKDCTTKSIGIRGTATFESGEAVTKPEGAKTLDTTLTTVFVTVSQAELVAYFNLDSETSKMLCGGGWVIDKEKELTAELCKGSEGFEDMFKQSFSIYKVDASGLWIGKTGEKDSASDGSTAAKRATEFGKRASTKS
jgi:hypothetical protein